MLQALTMTLGGMQSQYSSAERHQGSQEFAKSSAHRIRSCPSLLYCLLHAQPLQQQCTPKGCCHPSAHTASRLKADCNTSDVHSRRPAPAAASLRRLLWRGPAVATGTAGSPGRRAAPPATPVPAAVATAAITPVLAPPFARWTATVAPEATATAAAPTPTPVRVDNGVLPGVLAALLRILPRKSNLTHSRMSSVPQKAHLSPPRPRPGAGTSASLALRAPLPCCCGRAKPPAGGCCCG